VYQLVGQKSNTELLAGDTGDDSLEIPYMIPKAGVAPKVEESSGLKEWKDTLPQQKEMEKWWEKRCKEEGRLIEPQEFHTMEKRDLEQEARWISPVAWGGISGFYTP